MELVVQAPKPFSDNVKKKKILPLSQLVEETRRTGNVPHHLLETSIYNKVKGNDVVEAEPSELHFSGFEVGKVYKKSVKIINTSSEVINIHILPTQTKYFSTQYMKKSRLVPGLSYTVTVHFSPNEWRYFFDSIRVHCKGETNLLVPVHAYPVIDDLRIPPHIRLPDVPLGRSASHVIPLSCKCPIDFEFQVHYLKPHDAFTVQPLSGIIPASGKTHFTVTFTPHQYGTAEITLQLVISQFNSKPVICTLTACCSPYLSLSLQDKDNEKDQMFADGRKTEGPSTLTLPAVPKFKPAQSITKRSKKTAKSDTVPQASIVDVSTPAGLVKMLIQHQDKKNYKDLREAMSLDKTAHQTRQMREAAFENQVRANVQKERANHLQWQVHLGESLWSTEQKMNVLREQEFAAAEYLMKNEPCGREDNFTRDFTKLSSQRVLRNAGQLPDSTPIFCIYESSNLEVRQRVLRLFQQAVRKVILRCRMINRLLLLRDLVSRMKRHTAADGDSGGAKEADEKPPLLKMSAEKLLPFEIPIFTPVNQLDELAVEGLGHVPVRQIKMDLTLNIPFFNLKVPQYYRLMGYQEINAYDAGASWVGTELARPVRTGAQDELVPAVTEELQGLEQDRGYALRFSTPRNMLSPPNAHPLRIFNPAPGVHAFRPTPYYLESDLEFHLCPLPRYTVTKGNVTGIYTPSTQKRFLDRKDIIKGIMTWKKFPSLALTTFASTSARTNSWAPRLSDPFNSSLLPLEAPPALQDLPDSMRESVISDMVEGTEASLTPEMVQAEFAPAENVSPKPLIEDITKDDREKREQLLQSILKSQTNKLGPKVLARMKHLKSLEQNSLNST